MHTQSLTYLNSSAIAACELVDLLPQNDLIQELKNLLNTQAYISNLMLINKPLPDKECDELTLYAKEIEVEALRIKQANHKQAL